MAGRECVFATCHTKLHSNGLDQVVLQMMLSGDPERWGLPTTFSFRFESTGKRRENQNSVVSEAGIGMSF